jgi:hypothetical protein
MFAAMSAPRPDLCPLCGATNDCAMARVGSAGCADCWCSRARIAAETLAAIPAAARGVACVCRTCATGRGDQDVGRARD